MGNVPAGGTLKKSIGFLGLLAMCVGLNIGGALFALTHLAAGLTGPSLPLATLVASIPALLAIVPYWILSSAWPTTSATYRYVQLVNPMLAFVCLLSIAVCIAIGGQPLYALAFGKYAAELVPIDPVVIGVLVLTVFYLINLVGIRLTARIQVLLFFVLLSALGMYVVLGLPVLDSGRFAEPFPKGFGGFMAAVGLLFTFTAGGFFVVDLGGEVIMARKNFPRVLVLGMLIAIVIYVLIHVVTAGAIDWRHLQGRSLIDVAENFMGGAALTYFIIGGALVACATTLNIIFSIVSRGLMVVSDEGLLPAFLGRVNKRFGTPHWGLTVTYLVCVASLVAIPSLMFFGAMLNLAMVLAITVVCVAALVVRKRFPSLYGRSSLKLSPGLLTTVCSAVIGANTLILVFLSLAIGKASLVFLGILVSVFVYSLARRRLFETIGENIMDRLALVVGDEDR